MKSTGIHSAAFPQTATSSEFHTGLTRLEYTVIHLVAAVEASPQPGGGGIHIDKILVAAKALLEACAREEAGGE